MTNLQVEREILKVTKYAGNFKIVIGLWYDGKWISNIIDIIDLDKNVDIRHSIDLPSDSLNLSDNETDIKILRVEQNKLYNYLSKKFDNVKKYEGNV